MARKVTDEMIIQINEMYLECGVKKRVAEALGLSTSTISKYIIPNYVSTANAKPIEFDKEPTGAAALIERIKNSGLEPAAAFARDCDMSEEEWTDLATLQKGIMI